MKPRWSDLCRLNRMVSIDNGSRAECIHERRLMHEITTLTLFQHMAQTNIQLMRDTNWFSHERNSRSTIYAVCAVDIRSSRVSLSRSRFCVALFMSCVLCICWGRQQYNECRHWKLQLSLVPTFIEIASKSWARAISVWTRKRPSAHWRVETWS